jgi:murein DD-endopeptidase MepM/ murein hydrolase activator NlpD
MNMRRAAFLVSLFLAWTLAAAAEPTTLDLKARKYAPGEIVLVILTSPLKAKDFTGEFLGEKLSFFDGAPGKVLSFAAIDLDAPIGETALVVRIQQASGRELVLERKIGVEKVWFPIRSLTVDEKFVTPNAEESRRIDEEAVEQKGIFSAVSEERILEGDFGSPLSGRVTGRFGVRRTFNGQPRRPHSGEDIKAPKGTPVKASAAGRVVYAKDTYMLGEMVVLDHGFGLFSYYGHLSKIRTEVGKLLKAGEVVGDVGNTGRTTGFNCHWGVKLYNLRIDPNSIRSLDLKSEL